MQYPRIMYFLKVTGAFIAAAMTAAIIFALEFVGEGYVDGAPVSAGMFLFVVALNMFVGLPAALVGGVPIWILFEHRRVHSPWGYASAGATLALIAYLLLVGMGMGQSSDHPMTFFENLDRLLHLPRIACAMVAGACGSLVFRYIAVSRFQTQSVTRRGVTT